MNVSLKLGALVLFCLGLSWFFFSNQSLRLDEAQSLWQSGRSISDILTLVAKDVHVPFYHILLHLWRTFVGNTLEAARLMSLLFYVLCIPAIYYLGKLSYSRSVGLFAAVLMAASPFMNWYGNEIRMYTLFTFLIICNQYFFIKIRKTNSDHAWIGYAATAILGVYSHYFFLVNLGVQGLFFLFTRSHFPHLALRRFMMTGALVVLSFVPWVSYVYTLGEALNQQPLLPVPTAVNIFSAFSQFLFGFQNDHLNTFFLSLWPLAVIFGFVSLRKNSRPSIETLYFLTAVLASVVVLFIISVTLQPVFVSRYLIFTVPALYLLISSAVEQYSARTTAILKVGLTALLAIMLVVEIVNPTAPVKENYFEATEYLNAHASPADIVLVSAPFTVYPVEYYYRAPAPLITLPLWDRYSFGPIPSFSQNELEEEIPKVLRSNRNAWLLLSYDQGYEKNIREYFDTHYERIAEKQFSPGLTLYEYKIRYDAQARL